MGMSMEDFELALKEMITNDEKNDNVGSTTK
jgi:hypothetical protein